MKRILVVEDNLVNLMVIVQMLENLGYEVLQAKSGHEALEVLQRNFWDVNAVLTDLQMDSMDGWDLIERIRTQSKVRLPIMMITATFVDEVIKQAAAVGVPLLGKPVKYEDLKRELREMIGQTEQA